MKYVIVRSLTTGGHYLPCVFDEGVDHVLVATTLMIHCRVRAEQIKDVVVGAGFCSGGGAGRLVVDRGRTATGLGIGPGELDEFILQMFLGEGLSGLDLMNMVTLAELKGVGAALGLRERAAAGRVEGAGKGAAQPKGGKKVTPRNKAKK